MTEHDGIDRASAAAAALRMGGKFIEQMLTAAKFLDGERAKRVHDAVPGKS